MLLSTFAQVPTTVRMTGLAFAIAIVVLALPGGAPAFADTPDSGCANATVIPTDPSMQPAAAASVLCLINVQRTQHALGPVATSTLLTRAAVQHSTDMVRRKYFSHVTPTGQGLLARVARTGYLRGVRRPTLGETIAWGTDAYATPAELVQELMDSPPHRTIILDGRYRDIGVGLALGAPMDGMGDDGATLSLNFGRR